MSSQTSKSLHCRSSPTPDGTAGLFSYSGTTPLTVLETFSLQMMFKSKIVNMTSYVIPGDCDTPLSSDTESCLVDIMYAVPANALTPVAKKYQRARFALSKNTVSSLDCSKIKYCFTSITGSRSYKEHPPGLYSTCSARFAQSKS